MKLSKEIKNGLIIFLGITILFFFMKLIGYERLNYGRFLNIFIVFYGMNRTLQENKTQNKMGYGENLLSLVKTALIGIILSIVGLYLFIYFNGGQPYLNKLSQEYLFGKEPTVVEYCFGLFSEGLGSAVILTFICMLYFKPKNEL
jgi:hypothetical protein